VETSTRRIIIIIIPIHGIGNFQGFHRDSDSILLLLVRRRRIIAVRGGGGGVAIVVISPSTHSSFVATLSS
jgi:hypothetical protein